MSVRCGIGILASVAALTVATAGVATAAPPTSRPSAAKASGANAPTPAAGVAIDLSTPRSAALAWIDAGNRVDPQAMQAVLVDDPAQRQFAADVISLEVAVRRLEAAAVARYGPKGKRVSGYPPRPAPPELDPPVTMSGDTAEAKLPNSRLPLRLRRVGAEWRVDLGNAIQDPQVADVARQTRRAAGIADQVTAEVAAGRYPTAVEAAKAFRARMQAAAAEEEQAAAKRGK